MLWKPLGRVVRFCIVKHPVRGTVFLLYTDVSMAPLEILQLYGYRFKIELGFRQAVHVIGAYAYHFWMMDMKPRRRGSGDQYLHKQTDACRTAIRRQAARLPRPCAAWLYRSGLVAASVHQSHH